MWAIGLRHEAFMTRHAKKQERIGEIIVCDYWIVGDKVKEAH